MGKVDSIADLTEIDLHQGVQTSSNCLSSDKLHALQAPLKTDAGSSRCSGPALMVSEALLFAMSRTMYAAHVCVF